MEMDIVLDLQKLEILEKDVMFGNSCCSSWADCCFPEPPVGP